MNNDNNPSGDNAIRALEEGMPYEGACKVEACPNRPGECWITECENPLFIGGLCHAHYAGGSNDQAA
jgi:hypothetical protein